MRSSTGGLHCTACGRDYPERGGIFDFRWHRHDYYFNPVPREEMARLVEADPHRTWEETVWHFLRFVRNVPDWLDNIAVNGRYAWKLLLDLPPEGRLLDVGCGLGNLVQNLAPLVHEAIALDLTWERLQFARARFARFNAADRITLVAGGDAAHLPFPDAYFDCITVSGVLEWIADDPESYGGGKSRFGKAAAMLKSFFGENNPRRMQLRFLRELRRVLKPEGQLFVAIENRWGYEYFAGRPDHHSGLVLGSLLPRLAANAYSILRNHRPYRTYTHTHRGLRRLFAAAGMHGQELYGLLPGYSHLAEIVPAATGRVQWNHRESHGIADRIKRSRYFVPAFGMIAQARQGAGEPVVSRLLSRVHADTGIGPLTLHECVVSGKDKIVLKAAASDMMLIVKLPANPAALAGEENNATILRKVAECIVPGVAIPETLAKGRLQGLSYYVERAVPGTPLACSARRPSRSDFASKVSTLIRTYALDERTPGDAGSVRRRLAVDAVDQLRRAGVPGDSCDALARRVTDILAGMSWRVGLTHGDLSVHNLFVIGDEISGVIDWEYGDESGLGVVDYLGYVESRERLENTASSVSDNFLRLARLDWPCEEELTALRALYMEFNIGFSRHASLCLLAWLAHVSHQLGTVARFDPRYADRTVVPMLSAFAALT